MGEKWLCVGTQHFYLGSNLPLVKRDMAEGILFDGELVRNTALELVSYMAVDMVC